MTTSKTAIIKCGVKAQEFNLNIELHPHTNISKLYIPEEADATFFKNRYPQAEIVDQKEFILDDELIDHVIIYTPEVHDMPLIQAVLQSGKNVQIMHN
ncbi:MAG TPA: Gfo/Idh/MocA family oxidoreductase [Flavisolibacter sp.]|nr:Gfo/Idh/MocA family oxidoreductase [Flavisolibacter sp.]